MAFTDNMKKLGDKLKLNSHYGIERFGVIFSVLAVVGLMVFGSTAVSAVQNSREDLSSTALYVKNFTTSRTEQPGTVEGVYTSPDDKRAMVLMKFEDPTKISTAANTYQAYLSGANTKLESETLKTPVTGKVVVFGTSGYVATIFEAEKPFAQQVLNLTMRANSQLVYPRGDPNIRKDLRGQKSFLEHDQWRIYFNPGATGTIESQALGAASLNPKELYYETVVAPEEKEIRKELDDKLGSMRANLTTVNEYEDALGRTPTLDGDFLVNPREPKPQPALVPLAGDEIVGEPSAKDAEGNGPDSTMALKTSWVAPGGFDFDWRSGSVKDGYLDEMVPTGQRYGEWLSAKAREGTDASDNATNFQAGAIQWTLSNGKSLAELESAQAAGIADVLVLKENLSKAYTQYAVDKQQYQTVLPMKLLDLEVQLRGIDQGSSINDSEDVLRIY